MVFAGRSDLPDGAKSFVHGKRENVAQRGSSDGVDMTEFGRATNRAFPSRATAAVAQLGPTSLRLIGSERRLPGCHRLVAFGWRQKVPRQVKGVRNQRRNHGTADDGRDQ
jgi:hypothetical protein